jgi:hypothetical protein
MSSRDAGTPVEVEPATGTWPSTGAPTSATAAIAITPRSEPSCPWGPTHYGRLSGLLVAPVTIAGTLAPVTGTALANPLGGYPQLFTLLALISATGAALACGTRTESPETM